MDWLKEHMRAQVGGEADPAAATLDLVRQAAETLHRTEDQAAEIETRTRAIVRQAKEELKLAEKLFHASEEGRSKAEAAAHQASLKLEEAKEALKLAEARVEDLETKLTAAQADAAEKQTQIDQTQQELREAQMRITAVENERSDAVLRALAAERRAAEAEDGVRRIQDAIRVLLADRQQATDEAAAESGTS